MSESQINLGSEAARHTVTDLIVAALKSRGTYTLERDDEEQKAYETWVCELCGGNTFDVEYDYIGSGTNHLGCELKETYKYDGDGNRLDD